MIELLVVIAIIALLMGILVPTVSRVKAIARFVVCRSNLRQMITGLSAFTAEHNDRLLPYRLKGNLWLSELEPYLEGSREVYLCPAGDKQMSYPPNVSHWWEDVPGIVSHVGTSRYAWRWQKEEGDVYYGSYLFNGYLYEFSGNEAEDAALGHPTLNGRYLFRRSSAVRKVTETPFMLDANWLDAWPQPDEQIVANLDLGAGAHAPGLNRLLLNRHDYELGVAYIDGHVNREKIENLWLLPWHRYWRAPDAAFLAEIEEKLPD